MENKEKILETLSVLEHNFGPQQEFLLDDGTGEKKDVIFRVVYYYCNLFKQDSLETNNIVGLICFLSNRFNIEIDGDEELEELHTFIVAGTQHILDKEKESSCNLNDDILHKSNKPGINFENQVLNLVRKMGFEASSTKSTADGGVDIVAYSNQPLMKGKYIIQCKDWKAPVGEPPVRDLYGVVHSERANKGILITTSTFTSSAVKFAEDKPIELINGAEYYQLISDYQVGSNISYEPFNDDFEDPTERENAYLSRGYCSVIYLGKKYYSSQQLIEEDLIKEGSSDSVVFARVKASPNSIFLDLKNVSYSFENVTFSLLDIDSNSWSYDDSVLDVILQFDTRNNEKGRDETIRLCITGEKNTINDLVDKIREEQYLYENMFNQGKIAITNFYYWSTENNKTINRKEYFGGKYLGNVKITRNSFGFDCINDNGKSFSLSNIIIDDVEEVDEAYSFNGCDALEFSSDEYKSDIFTVTISFLDSSSNTII
ncbi:restriction endonuclease [Heliorestis convoluta]|uniref:restriction endonuclease n=1 Tax=Heliorestis convoluta TaxID=356322 RepID=UPI00129BD2E9|nr:restriction endonuclease [Heliorestis convoluta]